MNAKATSPSAYEHRLSAELDRILYQNYLTPRTVTDFWIGDRDGVIAGLRDMKNRVIRSLVLMAYVEVDDALNYAILRLVFGRKLKASDAQRRKAVTAMLDRMYLLNKLEIVGARRTVPKSIHNHVTALNTIRNTFAHRFDLTSTPKSKRLYKRLDLFTQKGLRQFRDDMWEVEEYFRPEVSKLVMALVQGQKKKRRRLAR